MSNAYTPTYFPTTWRKESREWAEDRNLPQSVINDIEQRLIEFRTKRDAFQAERQDAAVIKLTPLKATLKSDIQKLRTQISAMGVKKTEGLSWTEFQIAQKHNNERDKLYDKLLELSQRYQDVYAELSATEAIIGSRKYSVTAQPVAEFVAEVVR